MLTCPLQQLAGLFLVPYVIQRLPPGRLLCYGSLCWSSLTLLYAACNNFGAFMALRALLGFVESIIFPCLTMLVQSFYKKSEQPPRNASMYKSETGFENHHQKTLLTPIQLCSRTFPPSSMVSFPGSSVASLRVPLSPVGNIFIFLQGPSTSATLFSCSSSYQTTP